MAMRSMRRRRCMRSGWLGAWILVLGLKRLECRPRGGRHLLPRLATLVASRGLRRVSSTQGYPVLRHSCRRTGEGDGIVLDARALTRRSITRVGPSRGERRIYFWRIGPYQAANTHYIRGVPRSVSSVDFRRSNSSSTFHGPLL